MFPGHLFLGLPLFVFLPVILVWSIAWKGWALWLSARRGEMIWFIVMLILNTAGLLEIFYIFVIAKQDDTRTASGTETVTTKQTEITKESDVTSEKSDSE